MNAKTQSMSFDPEALGRKYQEERDKRLRADGNDQYQEVSGEFAYFVEDPYIENELTREAIDEEVEVVIIGGGFGGMLAAASCTMQVLRTSKSSRKVGTSVVLGTGTVIPALPVILKPTSISRCWKRQDLCRGKNTPTQQKRWNIAMSSRKPMV